MKRHGPIAFAVTIYLAATSFLIHASMLRTGGHLIYPLDDAYVHMAIAKNAAVHHVWGVTRFGFTSSTSSPLWTLLLALTYGVAGAAALAPLAFNLIAATLVIVTIARFLQARSARPWLACVVLAAAVFVAPLPTLTLTGMEHTVHALATLWFAFAAASILASSRLTTSKELAILAVLAAATTGFRYEGIFAVGVVALLFMITGRLRHAAMVSVAGALPVAVYGLVALRHGWYFFPNSVLLKGQSPPLDGKAMLAFAAGSPALHNLLANPHLLLLVLTALVLLVVVTDALVWTEDAFLLTILVGTALLHMQLARAGWFYRYEAYLVLLGCAVFGVIAADRLPSYGEWARPGNVFPRCVIVVALLAVAGFPFVSRAVNGFRDTPKAAENIYSQQYQMGLFVKRFYAEQSLAVNDIGAVGYLADAKLLDIYGLASLDVARLKRTGRYDAQAIAALAAREGTGIAMIYPSWLTEYGGVPSGWAKVGEWRVRDNVVLGENAVSFYAVTEQARPRLVANLRQFAPSLPAGAIQGGEYTR